MPRGHQSSRGERGGFWKGFRGTFYRPCAPPSLSFPQRLCQEIIGWKHLSHPNILPLLGVFTFTDPCSFRILTKWMPNGNVMQYARNNPGVNRLRLVRLTTVSHRFPSIPYHRPLVVPGHILCGTPSRSWNCSWRPQRGKPSKDLQSWHLLSH